MVAVAAGRRPGVGRRRPGCGGGGQQQHPQAQAQQQRLLAVAVAARIAAAKPASAEATIYGGSGSGGCCLEFLQCLLRALGVTAWNAGPAQFRWAVRPMRTRRRGGSSPRGASAEGRRAELRGAPGRIAGNGAAGAASLYTMQGKKGVNQDAMVVWENFCSKDDTIFCGVFDGHGPEGHLVAKRVRDLLPIKLSANLGRDEETSTSTVTNGTNEGGTTKHVDEDTDAALGTEQNGEYPEIFTALRTSLLRAFYVMDRDLKLHKNIDCVFSGTTAVTVIKQGHDLIIGNLGDSRAVLGTRDEDNQLVALQLTVDLKPSIPSEAQRIRQRRGRVFSLPNEPDVARVWLPKYNSPGLAMARAFGDFCLKDYGLISMPDVSYHRITEKDKFIVLATDGVWDVLSNTEVVSIISKATSQASAARLVVESANRAWRTRFPTSKIDDCAVVCLFLNTDATNKSSSSGTKMNRAVVTRGKLRIARTNAMSVGPNSYLGNWTPDTCGSTIGYQSASPNCPIAIIVMSSRLPNSMLLAWIPMASPFLLAALLLFSLATAAPESHLVTHLPGFHGAFPSKHYSGYITVDESHERRLFYYLVLSERDPAADPVVLWLNGGPGCSSFDGFVYENGPFNFERGNTPGGLPKLQLNPYSWSKVSNIVYLDSPAGVGMSYSLNKSDYTTGDLKTAADAHTFLLKWFELYPEFQSNPFYISGESYAGIYIPTITDEVVKGIEKGLKPRINLKGYLIGNGVTDKDYDFNSFVPFSYGMGLISTDLFEDVNAACHGTFWGKVNHVCQEKIDRVRWELKDLNKYNILAPCYHHPEIQEVVFVNSSLPSTFRKLGETERPYPVRKRMAGRSWPLRVAVGGGRIPMWPELGGRSLPCTSDELATTWLDDEDVRAAIHAKPKSLIGSWELYTARIDYYNDIGSSMVKYHKKFTAMGYRVLIYSGDHDLCIPFTGTEAWVRSIGYRVIDTWRPWYFGEDVAGYTQGYDHNLTFLTIKGAGHTVPEYKPKETLAFYSHWLSGENI